MTLRYASRPRPGSAFFEARAALLVLVLVFAAVPAAAQTGTCAVGTAERDLNVSDVQARLYNIGNHYWRGASPIYQVPQFTGPNPGGATPVFASGIWVAGMVGGDLRVAGARYDSYEFWPGPLDPGPSLPNAADCSAYDRIWVVTTADVALYEGTGIATADLAQWPVGLGAAAVDNGGTPIVTTDRTRVINLAAGERPVVYGSQTAFWVMNDVGNVHDETETGPLGIEVRATAFSVYASGDDVLSRATFYRYEVINRNTVPIEDGLFSLFADPDLGDASDDYIGTDTTRGFAYVYNADDDDTGANSYGLHPPAFAADFLDGLGYSMYYNNSAGPTGDPGNGLEYYRTMQALFREGQPLTMGGDGTNPAGVPTHYFYPGDPVIPTYWSEPCTDPACTTSNTPSDRRFTATAPGFRLEPGESRTFNLALLFARGASNLASITALRAASDQVQGLHDSGALYGPALDTPLNALAAPSPTAPADGAALPVGVDEVTLTWAAVPGAAVYEVEVDTAAVPFQGAEARARTTAPAFEYHLIGGSGATYHWRVRAFALGASSPYSAPRSFTSPGFAQPGISGEAIVEIARPGGADPCAGAPVDPGCVQGLGGNTVFHDGDTGADYYVTGGGGTGEIVRLSRFVHMASPDYYEIRFTPAGGHAIYFPPDNHVVHVPFELWNVRTTLSNASDDVRMIPFINPNTPGSTPLDWTNHLTGSDTWAGRPRPTVPVSDWIYWMMPDRPNGYALFETAAVGFGGPGAVYNPAADGDTQVEGDPYNGGNCTNQGNYVAWCYRNGEPETNIYPFQGAPGAQFVYPIGRLAFADLAGDGTTPPTGTVVRFRSALLGSVVANEPVPTGPVTALAVERVAPNPARGRAVVAYAVPSAGRTVVAVYDALGRRVAVLADGAVAAGRHEAELDTAGLSPGVYVVVVESGGARAARTLAVVR